MMGDVVVFWFSVFVPRGHKLRAHPTWLAMPVDQASASANLQSEAQALLDYTLTLTEGEELMFIMDVPYVPAQDTPIVLAQAAAPSSTPQPDYLLKVCQETESTGDPRSAIRGVDPVGWLRMYIGNRDHRIIDSATTATIKTTLLEGTKHGALNQHTAKNGQVYFMYDPEPNYVGNDRAVFMAEFEGKRYKIVLELHVFIVVDEHGTTCPPPKLIKVTQPKPAPGSSSYERGATTLTFADLPGGAVGQTVGATLTLDTTAAGYNWFIDYTPYLNEEYLPTADAHVWQAKEGSDAAGKMDMLSVLLHEYGHVLGIEHSADAHAAMAATLTPGTRRLPSADELALMAQLVSDVKTGLNNTPETPPTSPLPLGTTLGGFWLARMRKSGPGDAPAPSTANTDLSATPQYAVAANATLTNPGFTGGAGWSTAGTVTFDSGAATVQGSTSAVGAGRAGTATLTESATAQTRLNQLFVLGAQDRFLRFTLDNIALDDVNGAPDDAFEVALIDANTGLSLLGSTGLTRNDALLNLQADGTERIAPQAGRCITE